MKNLTSLFRRKINRKSIYFFSLALFYFLILSACTVKSLPINDTILKQLSSAEESASNNQYAQAARLYEKVIKETGIKNSKIFFNCANNYYHSDNMGKAIFYYLKAFKLDPHNKKIKANLSIARTTRDGGWVQDPPLSLLTIITLILAWISFKLRLFIFLIVTSLFWGLLILRMIKRIPQRKYIFYILGIVSFIIGISFFFDLTKPIHPKEGVVIYLTEGRSGDNSSASPIFNKPISPGTEFTLIQQRSGWLYIKLKKGGECWLESSSSAILEN